MSTTNKPAPQSHDLIDMLAGDKDQLAAEVAELRRQLTETQHDLANAVVLIDDGRRFLLPRFATRERMDAFLADHGVPPLQITHPLAHQEAA